MLALYSLVKIALAQLNPTIGAFEANFLKAVSYIERAKQASCSLIIFPELFLIGYPPKDLILKQGVLEEQQKMISKLCEYTSADFAVIVGALSANNKTGKSFYNSLYCLAEQKTVHIASKTLLPNYDVFDETRYFEPAKSSSVWHWRGLNLGLSICEDIWIDAYENLYQKNPINDLIAQGAEVIINASASPYSLRKPHSRLVMMQRLAQNYSRPVFYVNQIGANDDLIFDGSSFVLDCTGGLHKQAASFVEELLIVDANQLGAEQSSSKFQQANELEEIYKALVLGIQDYARKCRFEQVVIGLSGGIDSALVACLATHALGAQNVFAYMLPSEFTSDDSYRDAEALAKNLGINYEVVEIKNLHAEMRKLIPELTSLADENLQPRLRASILMAIANSRNAILLATGNKSEIAVGYSTLYGDTCGAIAPIGDLLKTQVYALAQYLNQEQELIPQNIITKDPSAELKFDQKDQDTLPDYKDLDRIVMLYVQEMRSLQEIIDMGFDQALVKKVLNMIDRAEYKRKQMPPILKIAGKTFGVGRRMPVAQAYAH